MGAGIRTLRALLAHGVLEESGIKIETAFRLGQKTWLGYQVRLAVSEHWFEPARDIHFLTSAVALLIQGGP